MNDGRILIRFCKNGHEIRNKGGGIARNRCPICNSPVDHSRQPITEEELQKLKEQSAAGNEEDKNAEGTNERQDREPQIITQKRVEENVRTALFQEVSSDDKLVNSEEAQKNNISNRLPREDPVLKYEQKVGSGSKGMPFYRQQQKTQDLYGGSEKPSPFQTGTFSGDPRDFGKSPFRRQGLAGPGKKSQTESGLTEAARPKNERLGEIGNSLHGQTWIPGNKGTGSFTLFLNLYGDRIPIPAEGAWIGREGLGSQWFDGNLMISRKHVFVHPNPQTGRLQVNEDKSLNGVFFINDEGVKTRMESARMMKPGEILWIYNIPLRIET